LSEEDEMGPEDEGVTGTGSTVRFQRERAVDPRRPVRVVTMSTALRVALACVGIIGAVALYTARSFARDQAEEVLSAKGAAIARAEAVQLIDAHNRDPEAHSALVRLQAQQIATQNATNAILERMGKNQDDLRQDIAKISTDVALIKGQLVVIRGGRGNGGGN
jgi:hypothetical protein